MFIKDNNIDKYNLIYNDSNYRIVDLINIIKENKKIESSTIQSELVKANIITIQIGLNDYIYYSSMNTNYYLDELEKDITTLFNLLRSITKEKIIFIGLYNNNSNNNDIFILNEFIKNKAFEYNINYIDLLNIFNNDKYVYPNSYILTNEGNKYISYLIKKYI